jgi:glycosyltransferase involved in cell wall biosynthesis
VGEVDVVLLEEWQRTLGTARFDHVIDFSGYSPLWARFVANAPAGSRSIWLHNDLRADQMRRVHGRRPHQANLRGVFFTYSRYDHLVSVSESLRDINARSLSGWAPSDRFVAVRNTIDQARIHAKAAVEPARDVVDFLVGGAIFVTVGRISPEKNHLRLVEAFAVVNQEHPETRLVIIGEGPLLDRVRASVDGLGLSDAVLITGGLENPWAVMSRCDWFVLSSDYEGQPMVILVARTLGLPAVTTSFGSVVSAVPDGHGLVVERSVSGLAEGMRRALAGKVPSPVFDPVAYNLAAMREFSQAIGEDVGRRERTPSAT